MLKLNRVILLRSKLKVKSNLKKILKFKLQVELVRALNQNLRLQEVVELVEEEHQEHLLEAELTTEKVVKWPKVQTKELLKAQQLEEVEAEVEEEEQLQSEELRF